MHKLITDLQYGAIVRSGRRSVTLKATDPSDPVFLLRRVIRYPYERRIKEGLLTSGPFPLTLPQYQTLHDKKSLLTNNLACWPLQSSILKIAVWRHTSVYTFTAIDVESTDSYFLKTHKWEQVRAALFELSEQKINLESAAIMDLYNPFALYAPFDTPSKSDFESDNQRIISAIRDSIPKVEESAGFMRGKVLGEYYRLIADLQRLDAAVRIATTPSKDDFENEYLES